MKLGLVGLPNTGKTTIFNALTGMEAEVSSYPYTTTESNIAQVAVPDTRLDKLAKLYSPKKITPATAEFVDIAGLTKGASQGECLGNRFLASIREMDALLFVVRCFEDENIVRSEGGGDPMSDRETINLELCMADIELVEKRIARLEKAAKGDKTLLSEIELFKNLKSHLDEGNTARSLKLSSDVEEKLLADCPLLTNKPILYCANMSEEQFKTRDAYKPYQTLELAAKEEGAAVFPICAEIESEIIQMELSDREEFLKDLGMAESGRDRLIKASYSLMGLMSFLTAGEPEVRAWTVKKNTKAPAAAGKIHKDIQRGFIRAEVVAFGDLWEHGTMAAAKEKGLVRLEGKEYIVKDGDVIHFRFNV